MKHQILQPEPSPFVKLDGYAQLSPLKCITVTIKPKNPTTTFPAPKVIPFEGLATDFSTQLNLNSFLIVTIRTTADDIRTLLPLFDYDIWMVNDSFCCSRVYGRNRVPAVWTVWYDPDSDTHRGDWESCWGSRTSEAYSIPNYVEQVWAAARWTSSRDIHDNTITLHLSPHDRTVSYELAYSFIGECCMYHAYNS